jgi:hypothetical protein
MEAVTDTEYEPIEVEGLMIECTERARVTVYDTKTGATLLVTPNDNVATAFEDFDKAPRTRQNAMKTQRYLADFLKLFAERIRAGR